MAGMLPGVESARRRRVHGGGVWCDSSSVVSSGFGSARFRVSHDTHLTSTSFLVKILTYLNLGIELLQMFINQTHFIT